jgi:hypothetical protein
VASSAASGGTKASRGGAKKARRKVSSAPAQGPQLPAQAGGAADLAVTAFLECFQSALDRKCEGLMIKALDSAYVPSDGSKVRLVALCVVRACLRVRSLLC